MGRTVRTQHANGQINAAGRPHVGRCRFGSSQRTGLYASSSSRWKRLRAPFAIESAPLKERLIELRNEIAAETEAHQRLERERETIHGEQKRIRENLDSLGDRIMHFCFDEGWIKQKPKSRAVEITPLGTRKFREVFGLRLDT